MSAEPPSRAVPASASVPTAVPTTASDPAKSPQPNTTRAGSDDSNDSNNSPADAFIAASASATGTVPALIPADAPADDAGRTLDKDLHEVISTSDWGIKLGGFFNTVRKQVQEQVQKVQQTDVYASVASVEEAVKNLKISDIKVDEFFGVTPYAPPAGGAATGDNDGGDAKDGKRSIGPDNDPAAAGPTQSVDIVKDAKLMFSQLASVAKEGLKELQKKEDAADEAIIRFGTTVGSLIRDAVNMATPEVVSSEGKVLFESKDQQGRRVFHSSRLEAQLHAIHSSLQSFLADPDGDEFASWKTTFDVDNKTDLIAADLDKFPELRKAMEGCVPEKVDYPTFWMRYYFLRRAVEQGEIKRKELLRGAAADEDADAVGWGSDSDDGDDDDDEEDVDGDEDDEDDDGSEESDDDDEADDDDDDEEEEDEDSDDQEASSKVEQPKTKSKPSAKTLMPPPSSSSTPATASHRTSNDLASEESYDLVSPGLTTTTTTAAKKTAKTTAAAKGDVSEPESDDDWE